MKTIQLPFFSWLFLLIFAPSAAGELFQWTDFRGTIHFTDNFLSVPDAARKSSEFLIRNDWGDARQVPFQFAPEPLSTEPAPKAPVPETPRPPGAKPNQVTQIVHYNPQHITIVQVTNIVRRREPKPVTPPTAKRNFDDRQYIHPSVFGSGPQQYIHP